VNRDTYFVRRVDRPVEINAIWEKRPWVDIDPIIVDQFMGARPIHFPDVQTKLGYDATAIYIIFRVADQYVCARKEKHQERVCEDSCVEFFFTPGADISAGYFNLEMNCGGTVYFHHQQGRNFADEAVKTADFQQLKIAHSLPKFIDPEIPTKTTWVVEYRLPFDILTRYALVTAPQPGAIWRANFYKCADESSQPHWLTWAPIDKSEPDFHRPEFFGKLIFEA
jgi:hypothetical protein